VFGRGEYRPETRCGKRLLAHEVAHVVQQTPKWSRAGPSARAESDGEVETTPGMDEQVESRLLVDDDSKAAPGQMNRSLFLERLGPAVRAAAEEGLAGSGHTARGCPWFAHYLRHYARLGAERIEADLRRLIPESAGSQTAEELVPLVAGRVRASLQQWAAGGNDAGLPEGVPRGLPGMGIIAGVVGALAHAGDRLLVGRDDALESEAVPRARSTERSEGSGRSAALPTVPAEERAAAPSADPSPSGSVFAGLGGGRPLGGSVRARMEAAFGTHFGGVRVHTTPEAARVAHGLGASAFTLGNDIAFAAGEYRPGSLWGDALLAHELAHTEQQRGATRSEEAPSVRRNAVLEADASSAAAGALARLIGGRGRRPTVQRGGLALQRCGGTPPSASRRTTSPAGGAAPGPSSPPATPVSPPPAAPAGDTESDAAEARAKAIEALLADEGCKPTPTSLATMAAIPGASATNFGFTKPGTIARAISPRFDKSTKECFLHDFTAASLTFDHLVFAPPSCSKLARSSTAATPNALSR
jgi:hypothetical protein